LVAVAPRDGSPELHRERAIPVIREELRGAVGRVVDLGAGLAARRPMQVEHHQQLMAAAPFDQPIDEGEAGLDQLAVVLDDHARVDRQPHVIEAFSADSLDVSLGYERVAESPPELEGALGTDEILDERLDL